MSASDPAKLFQGTADYYARYRRPYPEVVIALLVERFHLDGSARLLDLGRGTGLLALPLAPRVAEVVGLDPQPEMLAAPDGVFHETVALDVLLAWRA
jgi:SAM-dependent methyltransferase